MKLMLITSDNALSLIDTLLALPVQAFRAPFQRMAMRYQAELQQALAVYQTAQTITLPTGQPALQTQWHRFEALVRKMNIFLSFLTEDAVDKLMQ